MAKYQTAIKQFGVTGFIFIFHLIYNHFGHGVQSQKMNWVWLVPAAVLIWQTIVVIIKPAMAQTQKYKTFWAWGNLAAWSVIIALLVAGILEIAGTGSIYIVGYYVISVLLLIGGVFQTIKSA
ncbi:hypothetical protein [Weissella confusa]|uniref:hypothetical protein n=1 Tax=Weissella confusa TaxID=1583 RepID=UPI00107FD1D3|nr:hypothetical protein [Weissella confusa]TGE75487.1 hypothetical protein C6P10_07560 [Weissella confusa]